MLAGLPGANGVRTAEDDTDTSDDSDSEPSASEDDTETAAVRGLRCMLRAVEDRRLTRARRRSINEYAIRVQEPPKMKPVVSSEGRKSAAQRRREERERERQRAREEVKRQKQLLAEAERYGFRRRLRCVSVHMVQIRNGRVFSFRIPASQGQEARQGGRKGGRTEGARGCRARQARRGARGHSRAAIGPAKVSTVLGIAFAQSASG